MKARNTRWYTDTYKVILMYSRLMLISGLLLLLSGATFAQPEAVGDPIVLATSDSTNYLNPKWSPDGSTIAFSSDNYNGIWLIGPNGENMRILSKDPGIGFGYSWSPGGDFILARYSQYNLLRRFQSVKVIDVKSGEADVLVKRTRNIRTLPSWSLNGSHVAIPLGDDPQYITSGELEERAIPDKSGKVVFSVQGQLYVADPEVAAERVILDFERRNIIGLSLSPTGDKAVFQVTGKGLHIINTDGSDLKQISYAEQPTWTPDGQYVIATLIKDDGYQITAGELYAINVKTGDEVHLTPHTNLIAMNPSVSPCGNWVVFDNPDDGNIYMMEIKLNK